MGSIPPVGTAATRSKPGEPSPGAVRTGGVPYAGFAYLVIAGISRPFGSRWTTGIPTGARPATACPRIPIVLHHRQWLGRYDLVQEGYEQALAALELRGEKAQQVRICRAYLTQAQAHADRLLCQQLEEHLATWPNEVEKTPVIAPFPVHQLTLRWTLTGHIGSVWAVAISPDGQTLISGS